MNPENTNTSPQAPNDNIHKKVKKNKTPILILILAILTGVLLILAIAPKGPSEQIPTQPQEQGKETPAETTLSMEPATSNGKQQSVNVVANTGNNKVTGVQLELSYDPTLLSNVTITAGDLIADPVELLESVDPTSGRITYVLGVPIGGSGVSGTGTVATISYTESGPTGTTYEIKFLPKTLVSVEGYAGSAVKSTQDYSKAIESGSTTTSPTTTTPPAQ